MSQLDTKERAVLDPALTAPPAGVPAVRDPAATHHGAPHAGTGLPELRDGNLTRDQLELLKRTICRDATDDEFALFIQVCNRTGLDPFTRQIHAVKRKVLNARTNNYDEVVTHQTGIDGFRLIAERTGKYRGQMAAKFYDPAGNERAIWLDPKKAPYMARVGVLKAGFSEPVWGDAYYHEYVQTKKDGLPTKMWKDKPILMTVKCAEAQGLRKAFPQELSGLYIDEEIARMDETDEVSERAVSSTPVRAEQQAPSSPGADVVMAFGDHRGKKLADVPSEWLARNLRDKWVDAERRTIAVERLGQAFVDAVYAEMDVRASRGDPVFAPPSEVPVGEPDPPPAGEGGAGVDAGAAGGAAGGEGGSAGDGAPQP